MLVKCKRESKPFRAPTPGPPEARGFQLSGGKRERKGKGKPFRAPGPPGPPEA